MHFGHHTVDCVSTAILLILRISIAVLYACVYSLNASIAAHVITDVTHKLDSICPVAPKFFMGDFYNCILDKTLRSYEQYVTWSTMQMKTTLDLCYGSINGAYQF